MDEAPKGPGGAGADRADTAGAGGGTTAGAGGGDTLGSGTSAAGRPTPGGAPAPPPPPSPSADVVRVAPGVAIPVAELKWRFTGSGGPGGQHANTANTRVEVRFDAARSRALPAWARDRIVARLGGVIAVTASDERSQARNRSLAMTRLATRLGRALEVETPRRASRPTRASQRRRLDDKRRRGALKRDRRAGGGGGAGDE